jgi:hypothetical protein
MDGRDEQSQHDPGATRKIENDPQDDPLHTQKLPPYDEGEGVGSEPAGDTSRTVNPEWRERRKSRRSRSRQKLSRNENQDLQLSDEEGEGADTINPKWREQRKSRRNRRSRKPVSASPQELQLWLQQGGWRYVAAVAVVFIIALVFILSLGGGETEEQARGTSGNNATSSQPAQGRTTESGSGGTTFTPLPTVTPAPSPTPTPAQAFYTVVNTGAQGLFLRADHNANAEILDTLPDGTRVEQVGEDVPGPNYVWRYVRAPNGLEGWVAVDWLQKEP